MEGPFKDVNQIQEHLQTKGSANPWNQGTRKKK